jgi:hypothetical protein
MTPKVLRTVLLHFLKELDHDLGAGPDQDLPPPALLGVGDCLEAVGED